MSNLDPVIKAQLIKQVQDIANGMGEMNVVKNESLMPDTKIESDIKEQIGFDKPMQTNKIELVNQQPVVVEKNNPVNEEIVQPAEALTQESSQMTAPVKKIDPMILTVGVVAILVLGGLFLANKFGNNSNFSANRQQYPQQPQQPQQPPYINNIQNNPYEYYPQAFNGPHLEQQRNPGFQQQNFNPNLNNDIKSYVDRKLGVLEQRVDRLDHRTWLLAIANNENSVVSRKLAERLNASDLSRKYISFDSNWNLNKMPEFLRLTTEQRYSLLEEVDDRNYQKHYNYEYDYRTRTYKSTYVPQIQTYQPQTTYVYPQVTCQPQTTYVYPQQSRNFNWQVCP